MDKIPLFSELETSDNILISGAGGGYDIYNGLPLYFSLLKAGKKVFLANFSFTNFKNTTSETVYPYCRKVCAGDKLLSPSDYFPEKFLSEWMLSQNLKTFVYAFEKTGVVHLKKAYRHLIKKHKIDTVVLIDGGTDSLMFGDEEGLGTPEEDACSLAAVYSSPAKKKILCSIGFGVDHFHGVSHYRFLENVAQLIREDGFLGVFSLNKETEEFQLYKSALKYSEMRSGEFKSIVPNSVISSIDGEYGNKHWTGRTKGTALWINPLMSLYWSFDLKKVIQNLKYYDYIKDSENIHGISAGIAEYRRKNTKQRLKKPLPL